MGYMDEVLGISELSGGHAAPLEQLEEEEVVQPVKVYGYEEFLDFDEEDSLLLSEFEGLLATAGSKPAPKKDQIKGSDKNKEGSADTGRGVDFTEKIVSALEKKVESHNKSVDGAAGKKATLTALKAVYRRGAGAFSTSHRPDQNRNSWAMARVNAYLHLLKTGSPKNSKYTTDNDLLPKSHPKSTR